MKKTKLDIVFFHEMGHYIAHELNYELYGFSKIGAIKLIKFDLPSGVDYQGEAVSLVEKGQSADAKLVNLPEKIAELVYGCYFQSLYTNTPLKVCLDIYNKNSNGYIDAQNIASGLQQFFINNERRILYPFLHEEYFAQLKQKMNIFKELFDLNHMEYLEKTDFGYTANLEKLYQSTKNFRVGHKSDFNDFVNRIKEIINWKNTCGNTV